MLSKYFFRIGTCAVSRLRILEIWKLMLIWIQCNVADDTEDQRFQLVRAVQIRSNSCGVLQLDQSVIAKPQTLSDVFG